MRIFRTGSIRKKMKKQDIYERVQELEPIKGSAFIQGINYGASNLL